MPSPTAKPGPPSPYVRGNAAGARFLGWSEATFKRVRKSAAEEGRDPARPVGMRGVIFTIEDLVELANWWHRKVTSC